MVFRVFQRIEVVFRFNFRVFQGVSALHPTAWPNPGLCDSGARRTSTSPSGASPSRRGARCEAELPLELELLQDLHPLQAFDGAREHKGSRRHRLDTWKGLKIPEPPFWQTVSSAFSAVNTAWVARAGTRNPTPPLGRSFGGLR